MAEVAEVEFQEMSVGEADQLARDIQLGGPDYVLPNGQTKRDFFAERRETERAALQEQREQHMEAARATSAQSPQRVRVAFRDGQFITQPLAADSGEDGDTPTVEEPAREIPGPLPEVQPLPSPPSPPEPTPPRGPISPTPGTETGGESLSSLSASSPTKTTRRAPRGVPE